MSSLPSDLISEALALTMKRIDLDGQTPRVRDSQEAPQRRLRAVQVWRVVLQQLSACGATTA